jgi:dTDP-D-glucose 4,6-dehydratase
MALPVTQGYESRENSSHWSAPIPRWKLRDTIGKPWMRGERAGFRFLHISTDEVFGDLEIGAAPFNESTPTSQAHPIQPVKQAPIT